MSDENDRRIDELVSKILKMPLAEISRDMTPESVKDWDSLNHLVLVVALEEEFVIDIEPEEIIEMYKGYYIFK